MKSSKILPLDVLIDIFLRICILLITYIVWILLFFSITYKIIITPVRLEDKK